MIIRLDFETRSEADIALGGYEYGMHPSTRVLCLAAKVGEGSIQTHTFPLEGPAAQPMPPWLSEVVAAGAEVSAFNVAFEQCIWRHVLHWPEPAAWSCTMALCAVNGLPQSLAGASEQLGLGGKHDAGFKVMKKACSPNKKTGQFDTLTPDELTALVAYCAQDVELEDGIAKALGPFPEVERKTWLACNAINQRGVAIDRALCEAANALIIRVGETLDAAVREATSGVVTGADLTRVAWLLEYLNRQDLGGNPLDELTGASISACLRRKALPNHVRVVLEARRTVARASVKKLQAMLEGTATDGRLRGQFRYCGAVTGRWKSRGEPDFRGRDGNGVQLQNLPKPPAHMKQQAIQEAVRAALSHDLAALVASGGGEVDGALTALVRPALIPKPGHALVVVDYAAIEARGALWLADDWKHLKWFTDADRKEGPPPYCRMASQTFRREIKTKADDPLAYSCGKVQMLMLQYGAGGEKTDATCQLQGINLAAVNLTGQGLVDAYRREFASLAGYRDERGRYIAPGFWKQLERGALEAFTHREQVNVGPLTFAPGRFGDLAMRLPSGRVIRYHKPTIVTGRFGGDQLQYTDLRTKTPVDMYGGKWLENATQAVCRDLLADAMVRCEAAGLPIVMTVHDEIVCEVPADRADDSLHALESIMRNGPKWAHGFPIAVEGFVTSRYGKEAF